MADDLADSGNQTVPGVNTDDSITTGTVAEETLFEKIGDAIQEFIDDFKAEITGDDDGEDTETDASDETETQT